MIIHSRLLSLCALTVVFCQTALSETATIAQITDVVPAQNIGPINLLTGQYDDIALPFGFSLHAGDVPRRSIVEPTTYPNGYYKKKVWSRIVQSITHSLDLFIKGPIASGTGSYRLMIRASPSYRVIDFVLNAGKYVPKIIGASNIREFRPVSISTSWVSLLQETRRALGIFR